MFAGDPAIPGEKYRVPDGIDVPHVVSRDLYRQTS
jgi:hypothetical protein